MTDSDNAAIRVALQQMRKLGLLVDALDLSESLIRVPVLGQPGPARAGWYIATQVECDGWPQIIATYGNSCIGADGYSLEPGPDLFGEPIAGEALKKFKEESERLTTVGQAMIPGCALIDESGESTQLGVSPDSTLPLVICVDYGTGLAIYMATRWPVVTCHADGNLQPIAERYRHAYLNKPIIIAGDDDHEMVDDDGKPLNRGREFATRAALAVGAHLAFPKFRKPKGRSTFDDLRFEQGQTVVADQLRDAFESEPIGGDGHLIPPPEDGGSEFDFSFGALQERYTFLYGTLHAWDALQRQIIGLAELRAAAGKKVTDRWLKHPGRKIVNKEDLVFAPRGNLTPRQINLFRGFQMVPKKGECGRLIELMHYLCGESENVFEWVRKWIAFPLQNVGAKLDTCIVMHGPEGTGKNLLWGTLRKIYGEYGVIITQKELEGRFNGWASAKLFVVGNEVVPRHELYALKGQIKNMITESEWQIEEKHMPSRAEPNCANFVLLSNVTQPTTPDSDDRRQAVIWTPEPKEKSFYDALGKELQNGGIEAFYHHLLYEVDCSDFNEHTLAISTDAKQRLIEVSMDTPERFWRQWSGGELKYKYKPAPTMLVYQAYQRWCVARGEKVLREIQFSTSLHRRMLKLKKWHDVGAQSPKQRWFFLPHEWSCPDGKKEAEALGECADFFRQQVEGDNRAS